MTRAALILLFLTLSCTLRSQADTGVHVHRGRKIFLIGATALTGASSLAYLHDAWYRKHNSGSFHFFNDNAEWLQMDKAGHAYTGYQTGRLLMDAYRWAGFPRRQQLLFGGTTGFIYLAVIEVFDGFSRGWGFSWGDMAANASGSALAVTQEYFWRRQVFQLKFSYHASGIARYNPSLLGETPATRVLKDYNGQVYWLSFNPFRLNKNGGRGFPPWLNIAVGYGATGMTGGHANTVNVTDEQGNPLFFERQRLVYLSLDVDLTRIPCRSRPLRTIFSVLNVLKVPFPAVAISEQGITGHLLR